MESPVPLSRDIVSSLIGSFVFRKQFNQIEMQFRG